MNTPTRSTAQLQLLDGGARISTNRNSGNRSTGSRTTGRSSHDWMLDERTRRVGREGVAQAKAILQRVSPPVPVDGHRRAS
jgi:hypothetical protein